MSPAKRAFDLIAAGTGVVLLSPLFGIVALAIKMSDGGPVFYRQERVGRGGELFRIWKFRTMVADADKRGGPLTVGRDPRITATGHWLRKTKLDELPQLFNVLAGTMSLVGPRPEVPRYVALYHDEQRRVLELTPGITDPASIHFRNESDVLAGTDDPETYYIRQIIPEKIRINITYADGANVLTDFYSILKTVWVLGRAK
ncbi:MAG: sugar transferase [Geminicoccaceae bacterium]